MVHNMLAKLRNLKHIKMEKEIFGKGASK